MSRLSGRSILAALIAAAVAVTVGAALVYVGSPGEARRHRFDDRRVSDLNEIAGSVDRFWATYTRLPMSLEEGRTSSVPRDPESGEPYAYRVIDGRPEVYSVWRNGKDDGGVFERPAPGMDGPDMRQWGAE